MKTRPASLQAAYNGPTLADQATLMSHISRPTKERKMKQVFPNSAFLHGRNLKSNDNRRIREGLFYIAILQKAPFDGLKMNSSVNSTGVISMAQYHSYFSTTILPQPRKPITNLSVFGILGRTRTVEVVIIKMFFEI